jgi:hypothetical protein
MTEIPLPEDEAARYVLGELAPAELRRFEARLEKSEELRALVRELKAGAVAAALAAPQRTLPASLWSQIQTAVMDDVKREAESPTFWRIARVQAGWWAAAACLVGWLSYAFWINHAKAPDESSGALSENSAPIENLTGQSAPGQPPHAILSGPTATNWIRPQPQLSPLAQTAEMAVLRRQVRALETQVTQMSQAITQQQQQAQAHEAAQFTFFQLAPRGSNGDALRVAAPSAELQRALFFAMARELGWPGAKDTASGNGTGQDSRNGDSSADPQIIYLTPGGVESQHHTPEGNENSTTQNGKSADDMTPGGSGIPTVKAGANVLMVVDSSIVPVGSLLTILNGNQLIGSVPVGDGPTVVSFSASDLLNLAVTSSSGNAWVSTTNGQSGSAPH